MATWAFECRRCGDTPTRWFVACDAVAEFPADTRIVQVKVKDQWLCARLDRSRRTSVEAGLLRTAVPTEARSCQECADRL